MSDSTRTRLNWMFILIWAMLGIDIFSLSIFPSFWLPILGGGIFGASALFCYWATRNIKDDGSLKPELDQPDGPIGAEW